MLEWETGRVGEWGSGVLLAFQWRPFGKTANILAGVLPPSGGPPPAAKMGPSALSIRGRGGGGAG